jgi:hypothetical protein
MSYNVAPSLFTPKLLVYKNGDTSSILNIKELPFDPSAPLSKVYFFVIIFYTESVVFSTSSLARVITALTT